MTAIDDFVEKYESKIDKIKCTPVRDSIRGFIVGMDLFGFFERTRKDWREKFPAEFYSMSGKSSAHYFKDVDGRYCNKQISLIPHLGGAALGVGFSVMAANYVPWIATGALDLANLYLKKREKKHRPRLGPPGEIPRPRLGPREHYK